MVVKKKVTSGFPYLSKNLSGDSNLVLIREDSPIFRAGLPDFWGGNKQADTYPLVVPIKPKDSDTASQYPRQKLSKAWMLFVRDLNTYGGDRAVDIIFKVDAGWINSSGDSTQQIDPWAIEKLSEQDMPKPEFIVSSGSIVKIKERTAKGVLLDAFNISDDPPPASEVNFATAAGRIIHFMAGHKDGYYVNISSGSPDGIAYDTYYPLIAPGDAWITFNDRFCEDRVEFLPKLPMVVQLNQTLTLRKEPDINAEGLGYIKAWTSVEISRYFPSYTGVWGETSGGWIAIQYLPYPGYSSPKYFTSWRLNGIPALRPKNSF